MIRGKADELKHWIQNDTFWDRVQATVDFFVPLVWLLREFDGNSPQSGWLYWSLRRGIQELEDSMRACPLVIDILADKMQQVYMKRRKDLTTDFMLAAAYLNPHQFFNEDEDVAGNAELSKGFNEYIVRYAKHKIEVGPNHEHDVDAYVRNICKEAFHAQSKYANTSVTRAADQDARDDMDLEIGGIAMALIIVHYDSWLNNYSPRECVHHPANEIGVRMDLY